MIKISEMKIKPYGKSSFLIRLPKIWIKDLNLKPNDYVNIYRDANDNLILIPNKKDKK